MTRQEILNLYQFYDEKNFIIRMEAVAKYYDLKIIGYTPPYNVSFDNERNLDGPLIMTDTTLKKFYMKIDRPWRNLFLLTEYDIQDEN